MIRLYYYFVYYLLLFIVLLLLLFCLLLFCYCLLLCCYYYFSIDIPALKNSGNSPLYLAMLRIWYLKCIYFRIFPKYKPIHEGH